MIHNLIRDVFVDHCGFLDFGMLPIHTSLVCKSGAKYSEIYSWFYN